MTIVDGVRLISNSEIQSFNDCRRRWWLGWYLGLTPRSRDVTGVRATGERVHVALSAHYVPHGEKPTDPRDALEVVIAEDLAVAQVEYEKLNGADRAVKLKSLASQFELERAMIEGYVQWLEETGVDQSLEVIASETYVEVPFIPADDDEFAVKLIGKIDAQVRHADTGRRLFIDHKTGDVPAPGLLKLNQQMLHYHVIEWLNTEEGESRCDGALYNTLRRVKRTRELKSDPYVRQHIDHNIHELTNYKTKLLGAIADLVEVEHEITAYGTQKNMDLFVYPRPSRDCSWKCEFFKICHMFDDGSRVDAAIAELYDRRDPLDYYRGREAVL